MFTHKKKSYYGKGFTLLELMITVVIAGILASMAVPSFSQAIQNNRMSTQINELLATLNYARSEAIKRNINVSVCKSNNGTTCGVVNWKDGWLVFVDTDADGVVDGEDVLRVHKGLSGGNSMAYSVTNTSDTFVSYESSGEVEGFTPPSKGIFTLCDSRGDGEKKGIEISSTGRGRVVPHTNSDLASC
ncbi:MAG: GspH/FimT family pseudopilin [Cocleimonas sp.]